MWDMGYSSDLKTELDIKIVLLCRSCDDSPPCGIGYECGRNLSRVSNGSLALPVVSAGGFTKETETGKRMNM